MSAAPSGGLLWHIFSGSCASCGDTINVYAEPDEKVDVPEPTLCDECVTTLLSKLKEEGTSR